MGVTGYEVKMYRDIDRIATALERIAKALEQPSRPEAPYVGAPGFCPECGQYDADR